MRRIGVVHNPFSQPSIDLAAQVQGWLKAQGVETWVGTSQEGREDISTLSCLDLLIALGGDGTVLRAARLSLTCGNVPVLPVALGHLNFMAELQPNELHSGLESVLRGEFWRDERSLLEATIHTNGRAPRRQIALNEVVLARGEINRVMMIDVEIYHAAFTTYHADGVIVASATGSTAYALAAGGPIIDPRSRALVLVPIAAHLSAVHSLVLHEDAEVTLRLRGRYPAAFVADGRDPVPLHEGDVVEVRRAAQTCIFARVHPPSDFYARMPQRLKRDD
ncbi:MAG TPA: NAD(+)/NADH kinase [Roseiflexaceae bacterium]|nr:NAD(+)/NADH kinase [Roseiflexaceae bacterium]